MFERPAAPSFPATIPNWVNGIAVDRATDRLAIIDPTTTEQLATLAEADGACVDGAVIAARTAFLDGRWKDRSIADRQSVLRLAADAILNHAEELAHLETLCSGLPFHYSTKRHMGIGAGWLKYFADRIATFGGQVFDQEPGARTMVTFEPRGVAALFAPWNVPVGLALLKVAAAISTGNSVVLKPSEQTPLATLRAVQLMEEAGVPPGVINVVNGRGAVTGAALSTHAGIDALSFTGGGVAGRAIAHAAAERFVPVTLELGGKSACIVFEDADQDRALEAALVGAFGNNGQACLAGSRILVQEDIAAEFIDAFVARANQIHLGDPMDPSVEMGPIASEKHRNHILRFVGSAKAQSGQILAGGEAIDSFGPGYFMAPTVARTENPLDDIAQQEIFGPFVTFITFKTEEQAFEMANATDYGLVAYVWTSDYERSQRASRALHAGSILVNAPMIRERNAAFGGVKQSGLGSEGGDFSMRFYMQEKTVVMAEGWQPGHRLGLGDRS